MFNIRLYWRALLGSLLLLAGTMAHGASERVLVLGDSMSAAYGLTTEEGWVSLLEQRIAQRFPGVQVVNASISGETTAGGLTRLPALLEQHRPRWVIIELGGNDGLRGLSLKKMRQNLNAMVDLSESHQAHPMLVGIRIPTNYGAAYRNRFEQAFTRVAEAQEVPLVAQLLAGIAEQPKHFQDDGIHPNAQAQQVLLDNVWPTLANLIGDTRSAP